MDEDEHLNETLSTVFDEDGSFCIGLDIDHDSESEVSIERHNQETHHLPFMSPFNHETVDKFEELAARAQQHSGCDDETVVQARDRQLNDTLSTVFDEEGSHYSGFGSDNDLGGNENFGNPPLQSSPKLAPTSSDEIILPSVADGAEDDDMELEVESLCSSIGGADNLRLYLSSDSEPEEPTLTFEHTSSRNPPRHSKDEVVDLLRKSCCSVGCLQSFSIRDIEQCKDSLAGKKGFEIRQFVMDALTNHCTFRKGRLQTGFSIFGKPVCAAGWRMAYGIRAWRYRDCIRRVKAGKVSARRLPKSSGVLREKTNSAIAWMSLLFTRIGDFMPHKDTIHLPHSWTKRYVYDRMLRKDAVFYGGVERDVISYAHFTRIWKKHFPKYVISKTSDFTKCSMCTQLKDEYERATTDEKRAEIIDIRIKHDDHVIAERTAYQNARLRARTEPADMTCIIIDGMDQSKTNVPHFVVRDKDNEHLSQLPVHFTGVLIHSPVAEGKIPVIYHDIKHVPHDSNLTIHCLLEALRVIKESLGRTLFLQLDNCARENKNRYVLSFVSLLVQLEIFKEATIHFLPVGHTHEDVDQLFSRISSVLRHRNAFTLNDLAMETANSFSSAVEVVPVKMVQNIKDQLAEHMDGPFKNHSRPLWFRFRKVDSATYMHYKLWESDPWEPATDSEWPKGLTCLKTTPDLQQLVPWVEPSLEKANYEKLCHELPNSYNSRLPQPAREWWADFLANKIKPSYEEVPPMEKWGLSDLLERQVTASPEEDMVALESLRTRVERSCPQVSIGRQGICQRNINIVNDYTSLTVGMLAAVHLDETEGRPFIGKVEEVCAEDILIHWLKGTWTGVWRQWMAKQGRQCVPYTSKLSKSSLILWDFTLTQGRKLKQTTARELQGKYQELDG